MDSSSRCVRECLSSISRGGGRRGSKRKKKGKKARVNSCVDECFFARTPFLFWSSVISPAPVPCATDDDNVRAPPLVRMHIVVVAVAAFVDVNAPLVCAFADADVCAAAAARTSRRSAVCAARLANCAARHWNTSMMTVGEDKRRSRFASDSRCTSSPPRTRHCGERRPRTMLTEGEAVPRFPFFLREILVL